MPHKVNPDTLEVIKAKAAEVTSRLTALLTLGRASLTGYNREQQWTKYLIMETCLESLPAVSIMTRIVTHSCRPLRKNSWLQRDVGVDTTRLYAMAGTGFAGATELLEQLVAQTGVAFRRLKRVVEHAVALSLQQGESDCITHAALCQALREEGLGITVDAETVRRLQEPTTILAAKQVTGGPGRQALEAELAHLNAFVETQAHAWHERSTALQAAWERCCQ